MLAPHFYHQVIRKTIISFGTLFNNMEVRTKTSAGTNLSVVKVPIAYGPVQKFLARLEQRPELRTEGTARTAANELVLPHAEVVKISGVKFVSSEG